MTHDVYAIAFLALAAATPLVWAMVSYARTQYTPVQALFCLTAYLLVRILWRTQLPKHLPDVRGRGAVIVCNHRSSIDPFFIQVMFTRPIHWMVAREFCEHPLFGWFLTRCEVISVNRGGVDTASTKAAIRYVQSGEMVGMLPEGRINLTDELLAPARPGAAIVALKAKAPIIPCYVDGAPYAGTPWSPFFMRARATVKFGQPVETASYDADDEAVARVITIECLKRMAALAGHPEFEPRLAGRRWKPTRAEAEAANAQFMRRTRQGA